MEFSIEIGYKEITERLESYYKSHTKHERVVFDSIHPNVILKKRRKGYKVYFKRAPLQFFSPVESTFVFEFNLKEVDDTNSVIKGYIRPDNFAIFLLLIVMAFLCYMMVVYWPEIWLDAIIIISGIIGYIRSSRNFKKDIKVFFLERPFY